MVEELNTFNCCKYCNNSNKDELINAIDYLPEKTPRRYDKNKIKDKILSEQEILEDLNRQRAKIERPRIIQPVNTTLIQRIRRIYRNINCVIS
jgi:hypothetical protein